MLTRQRSTDSLINNHPPAPPADPPAPARGASSQVLVTHGIHRMSLPIGGLTVAEARQFVSAVMPIAEDAVAVIAGQQVDENQRLEAGVTMLSFVKPSSLRGAGESITIEGNEACLQTTEGEPVRLTIDDFSRLVSEVTLQGLDDRPFPDHIRWLARCSQVKVGIIEFPPELRVIDWIAQDSPAPYGPEATTTPRRLATPYVVVKVPFRRNRLVGRIELFYRNEPLRSLEGEGGMLYFSNLLNVSPWAHDCVCWCCTQYVDFSQVPAGVAEGLHFVANYLFSGKLNFSSEAHEGQSCFGLTRQAGVDPRVTDVDAWEAASAANPRFATTVPWKSTGLTVKELILRELVCLKVKPAPATVAELGNVVLRRAKPR